MNINELLIFAENRLNFLREQHTAAFNIGDASKVTQLSPEITETEKTVKLMGDLCNNRLTASKP